MCAFRSRHVVGCLRRDDGHAAEVPEHRLKRRSEVITRMRNQVRPDTRLALSMEEQEDRFMGTAGARLHHENVHRAPAWDLGVNGLDLRPGR